MTKPTVFNYKNHEELRQAYKELLADNQQLTADNRKLRKEVTELKQLNDGYVKIIAKNQETNNKLMASVQKQTGGDYINRADALNLNCVITVRRADTKERKSDDEIIKACFEVYAEHIKKLPSAEAVSREDYEDIIKDYRKQYENMNNEIADLEAKLSADADPTVIRAKTFMRKEDFDKWAEDIKRQNKNIVCIPCDAEVVLTDAVQAHGKWQRFNDEHGTYWTGCSNCKGDIPKDKYGIDIYTDFCPNCGARMKGGAE